MPPKKAKPKPLTQKAEKEMMGQEDIASTTKELDDAKARAVARMAKAREAKKAKAVAPSKENITMKVEEAPYGYTKSGKKRTKPLKEKAPKAPIKKELTLQDRILALPDEVRRYASEFVPTPVSIKTARRYIQLLEKGKDILLDLYDGRGDFWTQDGYYTTTGDKNVDEIIDDLERTYGDFVDVLKEAKVWFKKTYKNQKIDSSQELRKSDEKIFEPEMFGLEENRYYDADAEYGDDEFNGKYHLGDYRDLENGIEDAMGVLKQIIDVLKKGGFVSPVEIDEEDEDETEGEGLFGGALSAKELKGLLGASYDPKIDKVGDFILDSKLSTKTSKVYHNPNSGQTVVAHKGTEGILDWGNNAVYALGGKTAYKLTPRYKEAEKVQKQAEKKYGRQNVSTIGHSQGGLQAELLGGKSKEIITLNKATRPFESNTNKNQTDVRSGRDVVSALNPFEKKSSKNIEIQGDTYNPLAEHSGDVLDRLDENQMIGEGIRRIMEGGAVADQIALAGVIRQRFKDKDMEGMIGKPRAERFYSLLSQLVHSGEAEDIQAIPDKNTNWNAWRVSQANNAYLDRARRFDYVRPIEYKDAGGNIITETPPPPDGILREAIDIIIDFVRSRPDEERRAIATKGRKGGLAVIKDNLLENTKGVGGKRRPQNVFGDLRDDINDIQEEYRQEAEIKGSERESSATRIQRKVRPIVRKEIDRKAKEAEEARIRADKQRFKDTAFWTDENDRRVVKMRGYARDMVDAWKSGDDKEYNKIRTNFMNQTALNRDYSYWYSRAEARIGQDGVEDILKEIKPLEKLKTDNDQTFNITAPPYKDRNIKARKHFITGIGNNIELTIAVAGKGLPTNKIDFEDINWGSLTEQMKAYNSSHSKDLDLEGFARMIIADPSKFQKRTLQRARFYINVLLPKKK